jgi:hypothetical protein
MIVSDSVGSAPLSKSITITSLVRTPFANVLGLLYIFSIVMQSAGTGTTAASFWTNVPKNS